MMRYLKFDTPGGAEQRSIELWAQHLGHAADDGATQSMYLSVKNDNESFLYVSDDGVLLTDDEKQNFVSQEEFDAWVEANEEA